MNAPFRWLLTVALGLANLLAAQASHIIGGEIMYSSVASTTAGTPRYHVTVRLFRDIAGVDQPDITLNCSRGGCGAATPNSFTVNIAKSHATRHYPIGCNTPGSFRTYDVFLYETDVDLPRGQWTLSFSGENRAVGIRNFDGTAAHGVYISAFLDNSLVNQNTSPQFLSTLLPYLIGNTAQRYSFSAYDSEGDSLVYNFVYTQEPIAQYSPCSSPVPSTLSPHFHLNPATGALTTQDGAVDQGIYAMAVRVNEYRPVAGQWQLIGWLTRDVTYLALAGANLPPSFRSLAVGSGAPLPFSQPIRVQPGQTVSLTLGTADPDAGQALRFASDAPSIIPGLSLTTTGASQARLTWQVPASQPLGRYTATVAVLDDGCPTNASEEQTISFWVTNQVLASHPAQPELGTTAFPMPFREQVQFQAAAGGQAVTIVDELGRVVARLSSAADGRVVWQPAASLPAGLYVARGADGRLLARLLHAAD